MDRMIGEQRVSALGLGTWALGGPFSDGSRALGWGTTNDAQSIAVIQAAFDHGITVFDTADAYGAGNAEHLLGVALQGHRDEVFIATKWGNTYAEYERELTGTDSSPGYLLWALRESLRRLQTDYLDLYQLHLSDLEVGEAESLLETLEALVDEGYVRGYGWSTDDPQRAAAWASQSGCSAVQFEMNVLRDRPTMIDVIGDAGVVGFCRGPLAMGLLGGRYTEESQIGGDDIRSSAPEWLAYFDDGRPVRSYLTKIDAIRDVLMSGGRSLAQGAIGWLWARSDRLIPIPGARDVGQLSDNAGALHHGPLGQAEMDEIDAILQSPDIER